MHPQHPIERVLRKRGTRHGWLAEKLGISKFTLSHVLAGRQNPPADFYARAADLLGVPEDLLMPKAAEEVTRAA